MSEQEDVTQPVDPQGKIDLVSRPIAATLIKLAWPVVATMAVHTAFLVTDMIWVGRLGAPEVAGVISSAFFIWMMFAFAEVVTAGVIAIVARHYGAKNYDRAAYVSAQGIGFATLMAVVMTILGYVISPHVLQFMGTEPDVMQFGIDYLRVRFLGSILLLWYEVGISIFRATGDTRTPLVLSLVAVGGNIVLDPLFIFGLGPIPAMGVTGAAIATVISTAIAVAGFMIAIVKGKLTLTLKFADSIKSDLALKWQILKIGLPPSTNGILFSVVYVFLTKMTAEFGTEAIAALGVGNRSEAVSFMICFAFLISVSTMVGQNLGANRPDRAEKSVWVAFYITAAITGLVSLCFVLIPDIITKAFVNDVKVLEIADDYLRILAISQVFMAAEIVFEGGFAGSGNTLPPMIIGMPGSLARIPIAYLLCFTFGLGVDGVWWAITATSVVKGIVIVIWFRKGNWKKTKVDHA
jgi:putative MATE family efflux protein